MNFAVAVQSQEASRVANIPHSFGGRLSSSITGDVSRRRDGDSFEIDAGLMCTMVHDDYPLQNS